MANQSDRRCEIPDCHRGSIDNRRRRSVAPPHRVKSDADRDFSGLLFVHRSNLSVSVEATVRTDTMRRLGFLTLRTQSCRDRS